MSNHCPILLVTNVVQRGPKPFRFELAWLQETPLASLIPTWWASFSTQVRGKAEYRLQTKIQLLKTSLKTWSKTLPGNYAKTKSLLLDSIQSLDHLEEIKALDTSELNLRAPTKLDYLATLKKEEINWYQRSRIKWLKIEDFNTAFFHHIANCRKKDNTISTLKVNNSLLDQPALIEHAILQFFQTLYSAPTGPRPRMADLEFLPLSEDLVASLELPFSEAEIFQAIKPSPLIKPLALMIPDSLQNFLEHFHN
ncbi:hypothetical protein AMTRI_Chr01g133150 [Amborella trichopoda]